MVTPIKVLSQTLTDVKDDKLFTARFVGPSTLNSTRLTVHSAMTKYNDKVDTFRFRNTRATEELGLSIKNSSTLRFELLDKRGKVIADSAATEGRLRDSYDQLLSGKMSIAAGDHFVRVSRDPRLAKNQVVEYYFQITNGKHNTDYDTEETPPPRDAVSVAIGTQNSINALSQISTLQQSLLGTDNFFSQLKSIYGSVIDVNA